MKNYNWKALGMVLVVVFVVGIASHYLVPEGATIDPEIYLGLMIMGCVAYIVTIDKRLKRVEEQLEMKKEE